LDFARSSVARVKELFFLLTKTYIDVGKPSKWPIKFSLYLRCRAAKNRRGRGEVLCGGSSE
jgi:hypothetical protein